MEDIIGKIIAGLAVAIITGTSTWLYKRKFSLRFRHTIKHGDLNEFLTIIKKTYPEIKTIKVLANVTNAFLPAFQSSGLNVIDMQLLLRKPANECEEIENDYKSYFNTIVNDWMKLAKQDRIKKLEIKYFDFLTTDWQVIIDDRFIILGLNVPQKDYWKKFEITDTILIAGDSPSEKSLIEKYSNRFDRFFNEYGIKELD
jgi:hypothetical protein